MLEKIFDEFCDYLYGKLNWSVTKDKTWTDLVLSFFSEKNKAESIPHIEVKEHMKVDYIWRYDLSKYSIYDIVLAVEHEGQIRKVDELVNEEIQNLVDLKARDKIAIFYPARGDERELIDKISQKIKTQSMRFPLERYLIILGYATRKAGKKAILFKGFFFNNEGKVENLKENVILQGD